MKTTQVRELMEERPVTVSPHDTLYEASRKMRETGCGSLPVGTDKKIEGFITDRDIVVRAVAAGEDPALATVAEYMTPGVKTCRPDDSLTAAAEIMQRHNVSRLVVMNDDDSVLGILTFGRVMRNHDDPVEIAQVIGCALGRKDIFPAPEAKEAATPRAH